MADEKNTNTKNNENSNEEVKVENQKNDVQTKVTVTNNISLENDIDKILQQIDNLDVQLANKANILDNNDIAETQNNEQNNDATISNETDNRNASKNENSTLSTTPKPSTFEAQTSQALEVRIVEKNNLETDVVASLRDPIVNIKVEKTEKFYEAKIVQDTVVEELPAMTISSPTLEEGTTATFNVTFSKAKTPIKRCRLSFKN